MKNFQLVLLCCAFTLFSFAQKKKTAVNFSQVETAITEEGRKLYLLDMAATTGVDIFKNQLTDLHEKTAGYFPYREGRLLKCVFYNKMAIAEIVATISFDSTFNPKRAAISTTERPMTRLESDLYKISERAIDDVKRDTAFYKIYTNTITAFIPIIEPSFRRVFILTKSDDNSAVIFGNDYVLDFDNANYVSSRKAIHNDLYQIESAPKDPYADEVLENILHKHTGESGEFITSTDICILLLNQKKGRWQHHVVMGENYVSVWFCDTNELQTMTKKAWYKHNKSEDPDGGNEKIVVQIADKSKAK